MSKNYFKYFSIFFLLVVSTSCKQLQIAQSTNTKINIKSIDVDSNIYYIYKQYKDTLDKIMFKNIAVLEDDIFKQQPNSTLGNFMVDILQETTIKNSNQSIDFSILNYGGIRVPSLSKGNITISDIYNIMPFDNYIGYIKLDAYQIQSMLDSVCYKGGWPVSHITFTCKQNKAQDIIINNKNLDANKVYNVAIIDYIANGGDGMSMLKTIPYNNSGILFRDAIIEYLKNLNKSIKANNENRILYAK